MGKYREAADGSVSYKQVQADKLSSSLQMGIRTSVSVRVCMWTRVCVCVRVCGLRRAASPWQPGPCPIPEALLLDSRTASTCCGAAPFGV